MSKASTHLNTPLRVHNTIRTVQPQEYLEVTVFQKITLETPCQLGDMKAVRAELERIREVKQHLIGDFCEDLVYIMDEYRHISAMQLSSRCYISNKTIGNYRTKDYPLPDLYHVLALCIGLNLHYALSEVLIRKAGHTLATGSSLHSFLQYLLRNHYMETIDVWNMRIQAAGFNMIIP